MFSVLLELLVQQLVASYDGDLFDGEMLQLVHSNEEHDDGLALAGIDLTAHVDVASTNISSNGSLKWKNTENSRLLVATFS